jgi:hypothetical protein
MEVAPGLGFLGSDGDEHRCEISPDICETRDRTLLRLLFRTTGEVNNGTISRSGGTGHQYSHSV